jgi:hypothetical protein
MSYTKTETLVGAAKEDDNGKSARLRKGQKEEGAIQLHPINGPVRRRVCRRHSYAFRCADNNDEHGSEDDKHYESLLLVRVLL